MYSPATDSCNLQLKPEKGAGRSTLPSFEKLIFGSCESIQNRRRRIESLTWINCFVTPDRCVYTYVLCIYRSIDLYGGMQLYLFLYASNAWMCTSVCNLNYYFNMSAYYIFECDCTCDCFCACVSFCASGGHVDCATASLDTQSILSVMRCGQPWAHPKDLPAKEGYLQ